MPSWAPQNCKHCGTDLAVKSTGRPRVFCSPACKQAQFRVTKVNRTVQAKNTLPTTRADGETPSATGNLLTKQEGGEV